MATGSDQDTARKVLELDIDRNRALELVAAVGAIIGGWDDQMVRYALLEVAHLRFSAYREIDSKSVPYTEDTPV